LRFFYKPRYCIVSNWLQNNNKSTIKVFQYIKSILKPFQNHCKIISKKLSFLAKYVMLYTDISMILYDYSMVFTDLYIYCILCTVYYQNLKIYYMHILHKALSNYTVLFYF